MSKPDDGRLRFTRQELADLAGCSTKTLQRDEAEGLAGARVSEPGQRVLYDGPAAFQWLVQAEARKLAQADSSAAALDGETGEPLNKPAWDARYARARALAAEMELEADRGALVPVAEVQDVLARAAAVAKSLPRREAAAMAGVMGCEPREAVPLLERVSDAILRLFREAMPHA